MGLGLQLGRPVRIALAITFFLLALATAAADARAGAPLDLQGFDGIATENAGGGVAVQAGSHPYADGATVTFGVTRNPQSGAEQTDNNPKDLTIELPVGLVGNPQGAPLCPRRQFQPSQGTICPDETAVGVLTINPVGGAPVTAAIFNVVPPPGSPALFASQVITAPVYFTASVRTGGDYGLNLDFTDVTQAFAIKSANVTFWGDPLDPSHDAQRGSCAEALSEGGTCPVRNFDQARRPFVTLPTSCGPTRTAIIGHSWQEPSIFRQATFFGHDSLGTPAPIEGCGRVPFDPRVTTAIDAATGDSPTGLSVDIAIPQQESPTGIATSHLRTTTVALPAGLVVNPAAANGLGSCSQAQADLSSKAASSCPDDSKIGTVEIDTPLIDHPLPGSVYLATPRDNPFGSLLALYLGIVDPQSGVIIKVPGRVDADPASGRLTATFADTPQLPFESLRLDLFGGPGATLRSPAVCGSYSTGASLTPWSGNPAVARSASFGISQGANGGACAASEGELPNSPSLADTGTEAPLAGAYSPFVLKLSRPDGSQGLRSIDAALPVGLLARLDGIPYCPEASLAAAAASSGRAQQAASSCPAASRVGSVTAGAGAGSAPFYAGGSAYLAGPYKGAPLSLAFVVPAVAGPFDLGDVVVRSALFVDPVTTQVRAVSDPIPTILEGIPLDLRSIVLDLDRRDFTLNPTSCDPTAVTASVTSPQGRTAALQSRFQVGGCKDLDFAPRLSLALKGKTRRGGNPQLTATLTPRAGDANIARAAVTLPRSEFLAQDHIKTVCTRAQFAADQCPKASIYGYAEAESPLLGKALKGPVYLRSSSDKLPNLVAALRGQISIDLAGRIDSVRGGIRTVFQTVPDAPVSKFTLRLAGGKRGLLVNSQNVCAAKQRAAVSFRAHSGALATARPRLQAKCGGKR